MQCPGCGFENEKGNKFCNMCGMGLPGTGETPDAPAEREPLDLDLSLDLDVGEAADAAGGLSFDLGTPAGGSFDLSAGSADDAGDLQLDMPETPEGVGTLRIAYQLANYYKLRVPITQMIYNIVFKNFILPHR